MAWSLLGRGTRIPGGWELSGLDLSGSGQIRASARTQGGYGGASSGLVEATTGYEFDPLEAWRLVYFETTTNAGEAANDADPDQDGLENLVEYAFGLDPVQPDATSLPGWQMADDERVLEFTRPSGVKGISYHVEQSTSLEPGSWTPVPNASTPPHHRYNLPAISGDRRYLRIRVSVP